VNYFFEDQLLKNIFLIHFRTNSELKRHRISTHSDRPFGCPHCPHRSKTKEKMDKHLMCHLAKKSYECPHCAKKFVFKNSMNKHMLKGRCHVLKKQRAESKNKLLINILHTDSSTESSSMQSMDF